MTKNIIVFDLETQYSFDDVGGQNNLDQLKISVLGAYLYRTSEYVIFEEKDLPKFEEMLNSRPMLVGFNSKRFDCAVLQPYVRVDLKKLPHLDILEEFVKAVGHRIKLDSLAQATLGTGKSGSGLDALKYWRDGEIEKLKKYCLDDVKITKDIYEFGAKNGELFYTSKYNLEKCRARVSWKIENPEEDEAGQKQMGLF